MFRSVISCLLLLTVLCVNVHNSTLSAQSDQSSQEMKRSFSIIRSYESDGQFERAIEEGEKLLVECEKNYPELSPRLYDILSHAYSSMTDFDSAIEYADKAWVLYAGNHNILTDTYTNYETYKDHIKYYYDKKIKTYDQFGTIGDLRKDNPLLGLHEFKKKFGGDYVEFTGEFDCIINKPMYFIFTKLVPIYRNLVKKLAKKKRGQK